MVLLFNNAVIADKKSEIVDVVLITGEEYEDHPLSPAGVIARVLDASGFSVGIIEKPLVKKDYLKYGTPRLCFCVTSGSVDSMLNNYTPFKKKRVFDKNLKSLSMPDRAVIFYCGKIKELFKGSKIIIGGIEASLRRFGHYDYWDNKVRRSILFDSRADLLVYGNGEKQIIEACKRLKSKMNLFGIEGTCVVNKSLPSGFNLLPKFTEAKDSDLKSKKNFCKMQMMFDNTKNLAQEYDNNYLLQFRFPSYTSSDLDWIYGLGFSRKLRKGSLLKMAQFSVVTHRGCIGDCNFCSLTLHQGNKIISRSEKSIVAEIERIVKNPDFKGYIDDLGGPSANMYGMDCIKSCSNCLSCPNLNLDHKRLINLLRKARAVPGVKKVFVRSGIRYDLALNSKEYIEELSKHHISGCLKIAPEHFDPSVLKLMNKDNGGFTEFLNFFNSINFKLKQELRYYFMIGHPGENSESIVLLKKKLKNLKNVDQFQFFTPTPMTMSTCMYWTGLNPFNLNSVNVIYDYNSKKKLKRQILDIV